VLSLRLLDVRTGTSRTLVANAPTECPVWSPTGPWIAYANQLNDHGRPPHGLVLVDSTTGRTRHAFEKLTVGQFAWSPDSTKMVVLAGPTDTRLCASLWLYDVREGSERKIRQCAA
jgi:Tol biopolymer transport system component